MVHTAAATPLVLNNDLAVLPRAGKPASASVPTAPKRHLMNVKGDEGAAAKKLRNNNASGSSCSNPSKTLTSAAQSDAARGASGGASTHAHQETLKEGMRIRFIDDPSFQNGHGNYAHWYYMYEGVVSGERSKRGRKLTNVIVSPMETQSTHFKGVQGHCLWAETLGAPLNPKSGISKETGRYKVGMWVPVA